LFLSRRFALFFVRPVLRSLLAYSPLASSPVVSPPPSFFLLLLLPLASSWTLPVRSLSLFLAFSTRLLISLFGPLFSPSPPLSTLSTSSLLSSLYFCLFSLPLLVSLPLSPLLFRGRIRAPRSPRLLFSLLFFSPSFLICRPHRRLLLLLYSPFLLCSSRSRAPFSASFFLVLLSCSLSLSASLSRLSLSASRSPSVAVPLGSPVVLLALLSSSLAFRSVLCVSASLLSHSLSSAPSRASWGSVSHASSRPLSWPRRSSWVYPAGPCLFRVMAVSARTISLAA